MLVVWPHLINHLAHIVDRLESRLRKSVTERVVYDAATEEWAWLPGLPAIMVLGLAISSPPVSHP